MAEEPSSNTQQSSTQNPAPEALKPQSKSADKSSATSTNASSSIAYKHPRRGSFRPSHKATFIGLSVIAVILAINGGVIYFVLRSQQGPSGNNRSEVTLSNDTLDGLGVSRNSIGSKGTELTISPDTSFNGAVTIAGDTSVNGQLKLNSKFTASEVSTSKLQAGETAVNSLNVNGDTTTSSLSLRKDLSVLGISRFQGAVTVAQILTVNGNLNVAGNVAIGGTLSARSFQASSLVSDTTLVVGGHIITRGSAPSVSPGGAIGSNGTVSISGNDASGTVAVNAGVGSSAGTVASVTFRQPYSSTPHVIVTPVGPGANDVYINRSANGFTIGVGGLTAGGHAFDYIVMQ